MWASRGKVAIVGVGYSQLSREVTGPLGLRALEACQAAAADAGVPLSAVDGLATYPEAPFRGAGTTDGLEVVTVEYMLRHLKAGEIRWYGQTEKGMVLSAVIEAINAVAAGACNYALVWRALHRPLGTYGRIETNYVTGNNEFLLPYGFGSPFQLHALAYRRYMNRYGATRDHMATLVTTQRANANKNERAHFYKTPLTREEYLNARMISDPLCLYDCDIPVEGAVAVLITSAERARDLKNRPAYVAGYGQNTDCRPERIAYTLVDHIQSGRPIATQIWERSGLGPKDVDAAELYDGFSTSTYFWLESAGFCGEGEAFQFVQDGRIAIGGELPVNTHGGALSEGRLHSMGHLAEGVFQVTGRAGPRQVAECNVALVTAGSPMLRGSGVLLTAQP